VRNGEGESVIRAAVVTVSDTRDLSHDVSGDRLVKLLGEANIEITDRQLVTDDLKTLEQTLFTLTERSDIDLILTTGGTGFAPRDNTPEATRAVIEREATGIAEAMRRQTADKTPMSMLSRSTAGIRGRTLIINLPGSPTAVEECFNVLRPVLAHAVHLVLGDSTHDA
jgi:molybdopterin adenylyltransferase